MKYAESTVAMTAYNLLAMATGPIERSSLLCRVRDVAMPGLEEQQFNSAIAKAMSRGYLHSIPGGIDVVDTKRRLVRSRDRSDVRVVGGEVLGGWERWIVQCRQQGLITLQQAIEESLKESGGTD